MQAYDRRRRRPWRLLHVRWLLVLWHLWCRLLLAGLPRRQKRRYPPRARVGTLGERLLRLLHVSLRRVWRHGRCQLLRRRRGLVSIAVCDLPLENTVVVQNEKGERLHRQTPIWLFAEPRQGF